MASEPREPYERRVDEPRPITDPKLKADKVMTENPPGFVIAFTVFVAGVCIFGEIGYRVWLYHTYVVAAAYPVNTVDYPPFFGPVFVGSEMLGPYPPNTRFELRQYGPDGAYQRTSHVSVNNLGWVSPDDYSPSKAPGQFRVAILGDSLTASINNDIPWPHIVQEELRKALPQAIVMNLGSPGMNTQLMARLTLPIAQRLAADAVIVNMIIENLDFPLQKESGPPAVQEEDLLLTSPAPRTLLIGDVTVPFFCPKSADGCMINPVWNVPRGRELSQSEVTDVKQVSARLALRNRLLWTRRSLLFSPQGVMQSAPTASSEEQIRAALVALLAIREAYPNLLVTINPLEWYYDPTRLPAKAGSFISQARGAGVEVVDMREFLPEASAEERHLWWNMPFDGHWSNRGAEIYGRAIAGVIMERRWRKVSSTIPGMH
jgi:hypothetical protein